MTQATPEGSAYGVNFNELPGSPTYRMAKQGVTATRTLRMAWTDAQKFVIKLLTDSVTSNNRTLDFSDTPTAFGYWLVAVDAEIKPAWSGRQSGLDFDTGGGLATQRAKYDEADVTIRYETPRTSDIELDMGIQLVGRAGTDFAFADGTSPKGKVQSTEPVLDFRIRYDADNVGGFDSGSAFNNLTNIKANIGKVNSDAVVLNRTTQGGPGSFNYDEGATFTTFGAGLVLFTGADVSMINKYGKLIAMYDLRFKYKRQGWNKAYNARKSGTDKFEELDPKPFEEVGFMGTIIPSSFTPTW